MPPNFKHYLKTSRFRSSDARVKHHRKKHDFNIDLKYLEYLWKKQKGICPFTGNKMRVITNKISKEPRTPYDASLDRIDNDKGYVKGNLRFISLMANYGLNRFTDYDLIEFCQEVSLNHEEGQWNEQ
jgi:hypothetical protein